jgi:ABC-type transport system involved in cytochrome c biogenesis permease component
MAVVEETIDPSLAQILRGAAAEDRTPRWLKRVDQWATRAGDAVNPILVKETRQALKSRQFVVTFSLLLFASLAWTVVGSLLSMPQIYYMPSAPHMLTGYYFVLAVPMLLVVPLAAYRSLEGEVDDGTLELLSITSLSPRQIVTGKLASAALQMLLYFVALFPCVAFAYTLRGVDLPTLALLMGILILAGLGLTIFALAMAPVSQGRMGQIVSLLATIALLVAAEFAIGSFAMDLIQFGIPIEGSDLLSLIAATIAVLASFLFILLMATTAKLTPESENRSTGIRVAVMLHLFCVLVVAHGFILELTDSLATQNPYDGVAIVAIATAYFVLFWAFVGSMMCAEAPTMTARIRRELPGTFLTRLLWTWLTPGPATGLIFTVVCLTACVGSMHFMMIQMAAMGPWASSQRSIHFQLSLLLVSYLTFGLVGVRVLISFLRTRNVVNVRVGMAALAVVLLLMAVIPYSIALHWNDYRQFEYSAWQASNWVWTLERTVNGSIDPIVVYVVASAAALAFLVHLVLLGQRVLPQRLATPERVLDEYRRLSGWVPPTEEESDPLGLGTGDTKT